MDWAAQCAAVIPCLNEEAAVGPVVAAVRRILPAVIVVDDGSSDQTAAIAAQAGADVLRHPGSRGKGAALQTGWQRARERGFAWALTMDGDGQHAPEDVPAFLQCAEQTGAQLVVGNRMSNPRHMPRIRRLTNWWMSRRISKAAGHLMPDTQCGFRLMNLGAWAGLPISTTHFEIESEVLLAFAARNLAIRFVPIQVIYEAEESKISPVRDAVRWIRWWRAAPKPASAKVRK
jgi:glycosyltransferase involved in cell wall biosynthesis